ncbi:hypothetical protein NLJ89_g11175 [Agrocybe chaxingu]|uniref:Uncharacterized protein n=1 Tax=Agrocybe chaxingu TaxID=84603 RepID=A0A9W8JWS6_9AGAR|nr:hypothetical protein NLJ89_g11175 [Agrocybe chaxingu]
MVPLPTRINRIWKKPSHDGSPDSDSPDNDDSFGRSERAKLEATFQAALTAIHSMKIPHANPRSCADWQDFIYPYLFNEIFPYTPTLDLLKEKIEDHGNGRRLLNRWESESPSLLETRRLVDNLIDYFDIAADIFCILGERETTETLYNILHTRLQVPHDLDLLLHHVLNPIVPPNYHYQLPFQLYPFRLND